MPNRSAHGQYVGDWRRAARLAASIAFTDSARIDRASGRKRRSADQAAIRRSGPSMSTTQTRWRLRPTPARWSPASPVDDLFTVVHEIFQHRHGRLCRYPAARDHPARGSSTSIGLTAIIYVLLSQPAIEPLGETQTEQRGLSADWPGRWASTEPSSPGYRRGLIARQSARLGPHPRHTGNRVVADPLAARAGRSSACRSASRALRRGALP
jgi:hypothetical protein